MVDSQVPTLSPIKSPKRRHYYGRPVNEIPDAEPVPKKHKANQGSKSIWNCLTILETRQARENMQRTPHVPTQLAVQTKITHQVQPRIPELLALMIRQQEKNLTADNQAIKARHYLLQNLYPKQYSSRPPETNLPTKPDHLIH